MDKRQLVDVLTANMAYNNGETLKRLKFMVNIGTLDFGFGMEELPNCIVIEDWARYYDFDAAMEYENQSEFVAECLIEEVENRMAMEEYLGLLK